MSRATRVRDRGVVSHRHEADSKLERPGDFVMVNRGLLRSIVLRCPDNCGDVLTINLDPRAGKAWRFYRRRNQISVFPSVWRDSGCRSHFIVWHHTIEWCDWEDQDFLVEIEDEADLRRRTIEICTDQWQHFTVLAEKLDAVPWDINRVCESLSVKGGCLERGRDEKRGFFRLSRPDGLDAWLSIAG